MTEDLFRRLRHRYSKRPGYVLLEGVGNGAGYGNSGWSDAIAMQTWPSKGLKIVGFEVKASRQDWLKELDRPRKNREWQDACAEWYVVAAKGIVENFELPAAWGLMVPSGKDNLRIMSRSEDRVGEVTIDLVAAVFRAAETQRKRKTVEIAESIRKKIVAEIGDDLALARKDRDEAHRKYDELANALGGRWKDLDDLVRMAAALREIDSRDVVRQVRNAASGFESAARSLREKEAELNGSS